MINSIKSFSGIQGSHINITTVGDKIINDFFYTAEISNSNSSCLMACLSQGKFIFVLTLPLKIVNNYSME